MSLKAWNRLLLVVLVVALFSSCTVKTQILPEGGQAYIIKSKGDALVRIEEPHRTIIVDNRGRPGIIEQVFGAILMRSSTGDLDDK